LLTTMARNHRVLWLVSNLTKIMRVQLLHEQHLLRDAFDEFHDSVLLRRLPELPRVETANPVSVPQGMTSHVRKEETPHSRHKSLPLEKPSHTHQERQSRPTQRMCDVDDFLVDQSRSESLHRSRRDSTSSIVVCDVDEWLPNAAPRNQLYASWSSPNNAHSDAHRRQSLPRKGSLQGPLDANTRRWQPPRLREGQPQYPPQVSATQPRADASSQISEAQELLRQHIKLSQQHPNAEVLDTKASVDEHRPNTPVVVYNGPYQASSNSPHVHDKAAEFQVPSSAARIVSDVDSQHDYVPNSHPDQRGTMYVYDHHRGPQGMFAPSSMAHRAHAVPLPRGWDIHQEPHMFGGPAHHAEYIPGPRRAQQSVHMMPGVSPSEYLRRSQQSQMMQSELRGHDTASAYQHVRQPGGQRDAMNYIQGAPLQQFNVEGFGQKFFRRESGDPDSLCQVEEWLDRDAGLVAAAEYTAARTQPAGYYVSGDGDNSSDDDEWV